MALLYLDTSALVKFYVSERGSERMAELGSEDADYFLATSAITQVEFHSAIDRQRRMGDLDEDEADMSLDMFSKRFRSAFFRCPVDDQTLDLACDLVHRRALRAYDAVQLAACLLPLGCTRGTT